MKLTVIFLGFILSLFIFTFCTSFQKVNQQEILIVKDTIVLDDSGVLINLTPRIKEKIAIKGYEYPTYVLQEDNDSIVMKENSPFILDCQVDTSKSLIITKVDSDLGEVKFVVVPKWKPYTITLNNICDAEVIPTADIKINIEDNYNKNSEKPYKIIIVPLCDSDDKVSHYLVRYDFEGRSGSKCDNNKYVNDLEKNFRSCQGSSASENTSPCRCKKKSDCKSAEYKYFRICISEK